MRARLELGWVMADANNSKPSQRRHVRVLVGLVPAPSEEMGARDGKEFRIRVEHVEDSRRRPRGAQWSRNQQLDVLTCPAEKHFAMSCCEWAGRLTATPLEIFRAAVEA